MSAHPHAGHPPSPHSGSGGTRDHGDLHNPDVHHEESDINVRAIVWFVVVLTAIVLSMNLSMWGMFKALDWYERKNEPPVSPLVRGASDPLSPAKSFPQPWLQTEPWKDYRDFRTTQEQHLQGYGWVDEKLGVARIPIAKAKEMLLQRGLPVRPELAEETTGTRIAVTGESNSGRMIPAGGADKSSPAAPAAPAGAVGAEGAAGAAGAGAAGAPGAVPKKPGGGN